MLTLNEIIGQEDLKSRLRIHVEATQRLNDIFPHLLFESGPGIGKTTFAKAIATELNKKPELINCAAINSPKKLYPFLLRIERGSIVIADEVHALPNKCQELLYTVLENYNLTITSDKESYTFDIPKFTFIGCTTHAGKLNKPLLDRFVLHELIREYSFKELSDICRFYLKKEKINATDKAINQLVCACRFTPRLLIRSILWCRNFIITGNANTVLGESDVIRILKINGIDSNFLNENDLKYIQFLKKQKSPVGISTICSATGLTIETVETIIEPWLMRRNFVIKTPKGRVLQNVN